MVSSKSELVATEKCSGSSDGKHRSTGVCPRRVAVGEGFKGYLGEVAAGTQKHRAGTECSRKLKQLSDTASVSKTYCYQCYGFLLVCADAGSRSGTSLGFP